MVTCTAHSSPSLPLGKPLDYCAKGPYSIQLFVFSMGALSCLCPASHQQGQQTPWEVRLRRQFRIRVGLHVTSASIEQKFLESNKTLSNTGISKNNPVANRCSTILSFKVVVKSKYRIVRNIS